MTEGQALDETPEDEEDECEGCSRPWTVRYTANQGSTWCWCDRHDQGRPTSSDPTKFRTIKEERRG